MSSICICICICICIIMYMYMYMYCTHLHFPPQSERSSGLLLKSAVSPKRSNHKTLGAHMRKVNWHVMRGLPLMENAKESNSEFQQRNLPVNFRPGIKLSIAAKKSSGELLPRNQTQYFSKEIFQWTSAQESNSAIRQRNLPVTFQKMKGMWRAAGPRWLGVWMTWGFSVPMCKKRVAVNCTHLHFPPQSERSSGLLLKSAVSPKRSNHKTLGAHMRKVNWHVMRGLPLMENAKESNSEFQQRNLPVNFRPGIKLSIAAKKSSGELLPRNQTQYFSKEIFQWTSAQESNSAIRQRNLPVTFQPNNAYGSVSGAPSTHDWDIIVDRALCKTFASYSRKATGSLDAWSKSRPGFLYRATLLALSHRAHCWISGNVRWWWIASNEGPLWRIVCGENVPASSWKWRQNRLNQSSYCPRVMLKMWHEWCRARVPTCCNSLLHHERCMLSARTMSSIAPVFVRSPRSELPKITPQCPDMPLTGKTRSSEEICKISEGRAYKSYCRSAATAAWMHPRCTQNLANAKITCGGTPTRVLPGLCDFQAASAARDKGSKSLSGTVGTILRAIQQYKVYEPKEKDLSSSNCSLK